MVSLCTTQHPPGKGLGFKHLPVMPSIETSEPRLGSGRYHINPKCSPVPCINTGVAQWWLLGYIWPQAETLSCNVCLFSGSKLVADLSPRKAGLLVSLSKCGKTGLSTPAFLQGITTGLPDVSAPPSLLFKVPEPGILTLC